MDNIFAILLVLTVVWIALPFAVFGIKGILREIREHLQGIRGDIARVQQAIERLDKDRER